MCRPRATARAAAVAAAGACGLVAGWPLARGAACGDPGPGARTGCQARRAAAVPARPGRGLGEGAGIRGSPRPSFPGNPGQRAPTPTVAGEATAPSGGGTREFFAPCAGGLEEALAAELVALGVAAPRPVSRGVYFAGPPELGCRALVGTRTAAAVDEIIAVAESPLRNRDDLYALARSARPWAAAVPPDETLCVEAIVATRDVAPDLRHTHYSAITVCKAVTDSCREATGVRPSVDLEAPDWMLHLVLHRGGATLARRWSGRRGLHRRGYRAGVKMHKAALRETTAAGLLLLAGVRPGDSLSLLDPMCGSGTLVLEAAMIASDVFPGVVRDALAQTRWDSVPRELQGLLAGELAAARARVRVPRGLVLRGVDIYPGALALARRCVEALDQAAPGAGRAVDFQLGDGGEAEPPLSLAAGPLGGRRLICCNPPWGARLDGPDAASGGAGEARAAWQSLAGLLRRHRGEAWVLTPDPALARELDAAPTARHRVDGGPRNTASRGALGLEWLRFGGAASARPCPRRQPATAAPPAASGRGAPRLR